ncbi:MAG: class I SAM-dependent methyltransferase [Terriglobia bacterium]
MKQLRLFPLYLAITLTLCAQNQPLKDSHAMHALHDDPKAYIAALEDPSRENYQKPGEVLDALAIKPGEVLADIGAGSGYFTVRLSNAAGVSGKVYAVDVSPDMIQYLTHRIQETGEKNVTTVLAATDDPRLPDASVDRIFICDTWHHIENQAQYLTRLKKTLRGEGQIIMIDFQKRDLPVGPPLDMKISREDLIRQMQSAGFRLAQEHTFLPYQYFLVFIPQ